MRTSISSLPYLTSLGEDVFAGSDEVCGVEAGFKLGRHEFSLGSQSVPI